MTRDRPATDDNPGLQIRVTTLENEAILVADTEQIVDTTELAGEQNAAELNLGDVRTQFDIHYEVSVAGTIVVELSSDGNNWKNAEALESASGGESNVRSFDTAFQYARTYADGNDFNDGDITEIELVGRGV